MIKETRFIIIAVLVLLNSHWLLANDANTPAISDFDKTAESIQKKLETSIQELNEIRKQVAEVKIPLSRKLNELENELSQVRLEYQKTTRLLDSRTLDLSNLRSEIKQREQESSYLSNLLGEYIRNFESRLHIAELQRYREPLDKAKLAPENSNLSELEVYKAQTGLLEVSLDRLFDSLGGTRFDGTATDSTGSIHHGTFVMIGPAALFQSDDGKNIGTAELRLGSMEPTIIPFANEQDAIAAAEVVVNLSGQFPFDPTLGNAHKIEQTKETLIDHIKKGGPVMYPIFAMAGAAFLVASFKWLSFIFIRKPSKKILRDLMDAVDRHDEKTAMLKAKAIKGPVGNMLTSAVEHIREPRELIEEIMFEKVLGTKLKLEHFLPFIAICAASAPLLGLLGTVTGIINTFKLITVFGSGDVKMLSGGISEALITTEFGLIVAIPSLLMHAFLSRKAKGFINEMEKSAVTFINHISKSPYKKEPNEEFLTEDHEIPMQTDRMLQDLKDSQDSATATLARPRQYTKDTAGTLMTREVIKLNTNLTIGEAIEQLRQSNIETGTESVFVIDNDNKFEGIILVRHLLTEPESHTVESLTESNSLYVRVDATKRQVSEIIKKHGLSILAVLDHGGRLVGQINRSETGDGKWM